MNTDCGKHLLGDFLSCGDLFFFSVRNNSLIFQYKVDLHTGLVPLLDVQKVSLGKLKRRSDITWNIVSAIISRRRHSEISLLYAEDVGEEWRLAEVPAESPAFWTRKKQYFCGFIKCA